MTATARRFITALVLGLLALALALPAPAGQLNPGRSAYPADPAALLFGAVRPIDNRPIGSPAAIKTPAAVQWILGPGGFADGQALDALGAETRTIHPGRAMVFDGVDDYVQIPNFDPTGNSGQELTVFAWLKASSQSKWIFSHFDMGSNQCSWILGSNGTKLKAWLSNDGTMNAGHIKEYFSSADHLDGTWHLSGFTWSAGTLTLFRDAVADASPTKNIDDAITAVHVSTSKLGIGTGFSAGSPVIYFGGSLWNVGVVPRAISQAEWDALYNDHVIPADAVCYHGEEAAGTAVYNANGNAHHGTATNITEATFHATDADVPHSYLNEKGYRLDTGVYIPADLTNPGLAADGNALTNSGRVRYNADLVQSHCITLDGVDDYGTIPDTAALRFDADSDDFSIVINVKTSYSGVAWTALVDKRDANGDGYKLLMDNTNGKLLMSVNSVNMWGVTAINDGAAHQLAMVVDRDTSITGYVDAVLDNSEPLTTQAMATTVDLNISRNSYAGGSPFNGSLWGLMIFNRVLLPAELSALRLGTIPSGLVEAWPIQEGAGTTSYGLGGNDITWTNITPGTAWGSTQDMSHWNLTRGFRLDTGVKIPALADGSAAADGLPITNPAGRWHNGAETKLQMTTLPPALAGPWWSAARSYAEIEPDYQSGHQVEADTTGPQKRNLVIYSAPLSGKAKVAVDQFMRH